MKIIEAFEEICKQLQNIYPPGEAESIAYVAVEHYTGTRKMDIKLKGQELLQEEKKMLLGEALQQLTRHMPVQYVLGEAWFYDLRFNVNEDVLIPRPETEELVHWIVNTHAVSTMPLKILEIGTGSGCIAIALKKAMHHADITAIDVSEKALAVAEQNAVALHADIKFQRIDFLNEDDWSALPTFDIIVSNPPYIPINEKEKMDANVAEWEPETALFVPDNDPLLFYKKIAAFGKIHLQHHAEVFAECHQHYAVATKLLFDQFGYNTELRKDFFDNNRMLRAALIA